MLYCDHNSSTPLLKEAAAAMAAVEDLQFANPSAQKNLLGRRAAQVLEAARVEVAALIGAEPEEIVFTSGGTESAWAGLWGGALCLIREGYRPLLCRSAVEHAAVREAFSGLVAAPFLLPEQVLSVDRSGSIDFAGLDHSSALIFSCMWANNETGSLLPASALAAQLLAADPKFRFSDVTQAVGRTALDFKASNFEAFGFSSHKIGGPRGVGALALKRGTKWTAPMPGGGQENGRRGGTESVQLIAGFAAAAKAARARLLTGAWEAVAESRDRLEEILLNEIPEASVVAKKQPRLANTILFLFPGISGFEAVEQLDALDVQVSAGSACQGKNFLPSKVLQAMGYDRVAALSAVRVSLGLEFEASAVESLGRKIISVVSTLRQKTSQELEARLKEF